MARPSFSFYPDNYMNDAGLRRCSKGTRGIWMDLLCLMHQGVPYGHLSGPGGAHPVKFLASWCGESLGSLKSALDELSHNGVCEIAESGVIYSRRMDRDERLRVVRAAGGAKSSENENVPRNKDTIKDEGEGYLRPGIGKGKGFEVLLKEKTLHENQRDWFDREFWPEFWLKKGKDAAFKAFCVVAVSEESKALVISAMRRQRPEMVAREPHHRKYAQGWLNGRRFDDELESEAEFVLRPNGESLSKNDKAEMILLENLAAKAQLQRQK